MVFKSSVEFCDDGYISETVYLVVIADKFSDAMEQIENSFRTTLEKVNYLEPISSGKLLYITPEIEKMIEEVPENTF